MPFTSVTFAGHSAVFIKTDKHTLAIDPWLEGNPLCPEDLKNPETLDLIVLTHGHADHASDTVRLAKHTGATVAATYELAMILIQEGVPQQHVIPMNKGGTAPFNDISITLTHAHHSSSYDTANGPVYAGEACGVILGDGTTNIYHAGDTALFSDLTLIGRRYQPKIAMVPIGDHFTMGPAEAAEAVKMVGATTAIPLHYKTFDLLEQSADTFREHCSKSEIEVVELEPGATHAL